VCKRYNYTTNVEAMRQFASYLDRLVDKFQSNEETSEVFPNRYGPIVRKAEGGHELVRARWGMPSPYSTLKGKNYDYGVMNIRNTSSPHWRRWLAPEYRCLVPLVKFAEPDPSSKRAGEPTPDAWFARPDGGLFFFAGIWTTWTGKRMAREDPAEHELYAFLTTEPNAVVAPIHPQAMPVVLTEANEVEAWLEAPWQEAKALQRPLAEDALIILPTTDTTDQPTLI